MPRRLSNNLHPSDGRKCKNPENYVCPSCKGYKAQPKAKQCWNCHSSSAKKRRREDVENIGKCLDCGTKISNMSFRCHPCDGVRAASSDEYKAIRKVIRTQGNRIYCALYRAGGKKKQRALEYLGCSAKEFVQHLESKFQPGMTWENRGVHGWHMDHIRPLTSFNLLDEKECRKAFHYTNLQPLWAVENIKKGNKYEYAI